MSLRSLCCTKSAARRQSRCAAVVDCRRPAGGRAGFTLIELLLVAAILSIVAAIAVPRYAQSLIHYRIDAAARRVVSDIDMARTVARAQSAAVGLTFGPNGYRITQLQGLDGESQYVVRLRQEPYNLRTVSHDLGGGNTITFDGYGSLDRGGIVTLRVGGLERRVVIDASTGAARVER